MTNSIPTLAPSTTPFNRWFSRYSASQLRPSLRTVLRAVVGMAALIAPGAQLFAGYSASYGAGYHLFAFHELHLNNKLSDLLPSMPPGSALAVFDNVNQTWSPVSTYNSIGGWDHPNVQLFPGQGAFLFLPAPAAVSSVGSVVPDIKVTIPPGQLWLVSRQIASALPSSYADIVGPVPDPGAVGIQWASGWVISSFDLFGDGQWDPASPSVELGDAVWLSSSSGVPACPPVMPPISIETQPPASVIGMCGQPLTLTAKLNYLPGMAHTYRWEKNGVLVGSVQPMSNATYPFVSYTVASASLADGGSYVLVVEGAASCGATVALSSSTVNVSVVGGGVNAVPTLNAIPNPTAIDEDAPMQTINLTGISAGSTSEGWQTITITATSSNPLLLPHPTVSYAPGANSGTLSYTPVADENGMATITVTATDNGVTGCNPDAKSKSRSFNVVVNKVNDAPSFNLKANPDVTVVEDAPGVQTVAAQVTAVSKGPPNESGQTVSFSVSNNYPGLFAMNGQPAIDATGILTFKLKADQHGTAIVTVQMYDGGSGLFPNINTAAAQTFSITVTPQSDAPTLTAFLAPLTGAVNGMPFTITYAALAAVGNQFDADGDPIRFKLTYFNSGNGALTFLSSGNPVPLLATLGTGESWVWTPNVNNLGIKSPFKFVATDGLSDSTPAVTLQVDVPQ